jgi:hypothetical protein
VSDLMSACCFRSGGMQTGHGVQLYRPPRTLCLWRPTPRGTSSNLQQNRAGWTANQISLMGAGTSNPLDRRLLREFSEPDRKKLQILLQSYTGFC